MSLTRGKSPQIIELHNILSSIEGIEPLQASRGREIELALINCWDQLSGSSDQNTTALKLAGRIESLAWEPPYLYFTIERHGGTVNGSSRAELHRWCVDPDKASACIIKRTHSQLEPTLKRLNVAPLVQAISDAVKNYGDYDGIEWSPDHQVVTISAAHFVPANCSKQTLAGRRKRFRTALLKAMDELGWKESAKYYKYVRKYEHS